MFLFWLHMSYVTQMCLLSGCLTRVENYSGKYSKDSQRNYASFNEYSNYFSCVIILWKAAGLHSNIGGPFSLSQNGQVSFSLTIVLLQVAGRSLGELVRKLGERVLPLIIPILSKGLKDPNTSRRQVRMLSCCYFCFFSSSSLVFLVLPLYLSNKFSSYNRVLIMESPSW